MCLLLTDDVRKRLKFAGVREIEKIAHEQDGRRKEEYGGLGEVRSVHDSELEVEELCLALQHQEHEGNSDEDGERERPERRRLPRESAVESARTLRGCVVRRMERVQKLLRVGEDESD